jgi:diguanylate cyclase (GGDEF)-like protein
VSLSVLSRARVAVALDVTVFLVGAGIALPTVAKWLLEASYPGVAGITAVLLVVVMSRFPLVLTHRSGDVVIGFETCSLVFLVLTGPPLDALALWSIGMAVAHGSSRKAWRPRLFNVGLTIQGGGLLVLTVALLSPGQKREGAELGAVMLGCAVYFLFDLLMTSGSLAIEDGTSISSALRWRSVPLGLACFVSVDTLGYLAALLQRGQPGWTLLLLLVPVGTILVAVRSVSRAKLAQGRLSGLLEAAIQAPDWVDDVQIEDSLRYQAERTLRHSVATLQTLPAQPPEIGASITVEGQPLRQLVVRRQGNGQRFDSDDQGALDALAAVGASAFSRLRLDQEMTYLARHDTLTGLHNRVVFADRLACSLEGRRASHLVAVLYCDLDGFKEVNDLLGHETGDHLLVAVAKRVLGCLRPEDTAARLGGDEFGILLDGIHAEGQAEEIAQRLLRSLAPPFLVGGQQVRVQASIGIACASTEPVTAEGLLHSADTAMYAAKALGKGRSAIFVPTMRTKDLDRLELEAALRQAVRNDDINVHYQPVIDLHTGTIDGFEALARWTHPTLGAIPPDIFIPAAERIGLIRTLGLQILQKAHRGALQINHHAGRPLHLGVNVSASQLEHSDFTDEVERLMRESPHVPLVLELTEGIMLGDDTSTVEALHRLKTSGALLAIDDFGTGYSSIGYLHRLPLDILKIDKLFVQHLDDSRSLALVQGVVAMARAMQLTVVTEGVEDWECARAVRGLGCDLAQGYLFSRPVDLAGALALAAGHVDLTPMDGPERYELDQEADRWIDGPAPHDLADAPTG